MNLPMITLLAAIALFGGMLVLMELGARLDRRRMERDPERERAGTATAEGAVFALLGLLVAFTFSGGLQRFEARRDLIVQETNAIGTAWLRLDVLPEPERTELQQLFRDYLDARLDVLRAVPDMAAVEAARARASAIQVVIWAKANAALGTPAPPTSLLVLPALNEVFDVATARKSASENHPPLVIYGLLVAMSLACALLAGFAMAASKVRCWTHRIVFAAVVTVTVYTIVDLEFPRHGLIRVDHFDRIMVELRASMD